MPGAARGAQGPGSVRAACARDGHRRLTMRMGVHRAQLGPRWRMR
jgi:hypothetical protein